MLLGHRDQQRIPPEEPTPDSSGGAQVEFVFLVLEDQSHIDLTFHQGLHRDRRLHVDDADVQFRHRRDQGSHRRATSAEEPLGGKLATVSRVAVRRTASRSAARATRSRPAIASA